MSSVPGVTSIDFATFDFVRDSAPVVQGQRSLTISSDALTFTLSKASSLATTVLPACIGAVCAEALQEEGVSRLVYPDPPRLPAMVRQVTDLLG